MQRLKDEVVSYFLRVGVKSPLGSRVSDESLVDARNIVTPYKKLPATLDSQTYAPA